MSAIRDPWYRVKYKIAGWQTERRLPATDIVEAIQLTIETATVDKLTRFPHSPVHVIFAEEISGDIPA